MTLNRETLALPTARPPPSETSKREDMLCSRVSHAKSPNTPLPNLESMDPLRPQLSATTSSPRRNTRTAALLHHQPTFPT